MHGSLPARREIVQVCRRLYERSLIAGPDGNVSVRLPGERVLVTPAGMSKVDVTEEAALFGRLEDRPARQLGGAADVMEKRRG